MENVRFASSTAGAVPRFRYFSLAVLRGRTEATLPSPTLPRHP